VTIQVLDTSTVTAALVTQILNDPTVDSTGARVESNEPMNLDGGRCPWVGIYQTRHDFNTRTLGVASGFRMHRLSIDVVVTETSSTSGADCERKTEKLLSAVVGAILSDTSIGGTMLVTADPFSVTYANYRAEGNAFFKAAVISFTVEVPVTVT
jgi:hypothetical protein